MELSQKVDVVAYPVEPLRVEMRNGPVKANVTVIETPIMITIIGWVLIGLLVQLTQNLREIRDALKDLKPPAVTAPADAPKPPR